MWTYEDQPCCVTIHHVQYVHIFLCFVGWALAPCAWLSILAETHIPTPTHPHIHSHTHHATSTYPPTHTFIHPHLFHTTVVLHHHWQFFLLLYSLPGTIQSPPAEQEWNHSVPSTHCRSVDRHADTPLDARKQLDRVYSLPPYTIKLQNEHMVTIYSCVHGLTDKIVLSLTPAARLLYPSDCMHIVYTQLPQINILRRIPQ